MQAAMMIIAVAPLRFVNFPHSFYFRVSFEWPKNIFNAYLVP
jgi:hypothetical protein